nr:MAG TPA: hypothetical protein [Caudoviricetes sp.]
MRSKIPFQRKHHNLAHNQKVLNFRRIKNEFRD